MSDSHKSLYARWRSQNEARLLLGERDAPYPPERLLQSIWHHQRLRRDQLQTLDGRSIRVLHPGFWNHESGPDFRSAVVQFAGELARCGDIEIDLVPGNWRAHHHDSNPAFKSVILHVVWNATENVGSALPLLALEPMLDSPLSELQTWIGSVVAQKWPEALQGACCAPLQTLSPEQTTDLLHQAADIRFQRKAFELEARARQSGWEQALWEGLFRALGYKQNVWPMQRVAELLPLAYSDGDSALTLQARLFGLGGLLPAELPSGTNSNPYLRNLWDNWWREREKLSDVALPKNLWRFNGLRPANQPHRRLALAAHWLAAKNFVANLEDWFTSEPGKTSPPDALLERLQPAYDDFWSWHWALNGARLAKPQPLLGASRVTDLAINVILPWFWIRARSGKNERLERVARERYLDWPAAQDNAVLRLARQRLLGQRTTSWMKSAAIQQGLLQVVRDFCDHSNAICTDCPFPDLVRNFASEK